jgi:hypothetical protein
MSEVKETFDPQGKGESKEDYRARIARTQSKVKKVLYLEEFISAVCAAIFGLNVACFIFMPFGITIINAIAAIWMASHFKSTVLRQEKYALHLKLLETLKNDKVWTEGDKN